jgi:transcription-repair coupling factor (superfamily II helicase)
VRGPGAWGAFLREELQRSSEPLLLVRDTQAELEDIRDAVAALEPLLGGGRQPVALFGEDARGRLAALEQLRGGARLALALPEAFDALVPAPSAYRPLDFKSGLTLSRTQAVEWLEKLGYQRVDFVETPGEYAVRGAVLDFFGLEPARAVRVLYDEDVVASLRAFEPGTQQTLEQLSEARAVPAAEGGEAKLSEWLSGFRRLDGNADLGALDHAGLEGRPEAAWAELRQRGREGWTCALYSLNAGEDHRMQELLEDQPCQFLIGPLRKGVVLPERKLFILATSEVFKRNYRPASKWRHFTASTRSGLRFRDLRRGDYVVHQDYGVARYDGLKPVESLECLLLEFRGSDRLYIPMLEFGKIQKYSAAEGKRPRLSSLDTRKWDEIKRLVKEGVRDLAEQLLRTQAQRAAKPGHAFAPESPLEREFGEEFPYEETPDQAQAIHDTLEDMMSPHPMDRLVVGDVGFGKTEVAMRAAFKCVSNYKQAIVLVPTTILADQHYRTFSARFADYPFKTAVLTRFQTKSQQRQIVEALAEGKLDLVIGTARLLQKDVKVKDLGLIIIDEEHRFGVKDKERLKQMRATVDILALSATPIPRSLNQALSGLRGISLIESAPTGRQPIVTKVGPWDEEVVASAISEELARGGQAYYVHNRVRSMTDCVSALRKLLPGVRFATVHGQMKGAEIETVMWDFFNRKYDVLIASTIIESGLDIPTVNTLLVEDAHEFGLAQLYQLRGRIGRERQRAFCYLFHPEGELSDEAEQRLGALREFATLGAGIKLAMRDLEIRGAGDLLGARQHGFMNAVGVEFYSEMLNEEISRRKGRKAESDRDVRLDIKLPAFIPADYLPGELERLDYYKRILRAKPGEAEMIRKELEDLCGPAPLPVVNLFDLLSVRLLAQDARLSAVTHKKGHIEVLFAEDARPDPGLIADWVGTYKGKLNFIQGSQGDGLSVDVGDQAPLPWLKDFLKMLISRRS